MPVSFVTWAAIAAGLYATLTVALPADLLSNTTDQLAVMGQGALVLGHFTEFSKCIASFNGSYHAYEDDGTLVMIPSTNRTIDLKGSDAALLGCVVASASTITLATEDSVYQSEDHLRAVPLAGVDHATAVAMGVTGQTVVRHKPNVLADSTGLDKRAVNYYAVYQSVYSGENECYNSGDYKVYNANSCESFASKFKSVAASSYSCTSSLSWTFWPHHSCINGNARTIIVPPCTDSPCQNKNTYSWVGQYI